METVFDFDFNKYMENLQPAQKSLEFEINEEGVFNAIAFGSNSNWTT